MANFRIDILELCWTGIDKYKLKITTNSDKKPGVEGINEIDGTVSGQELVFYPGVISNDKQTIFKCDEIDFSSYKADAFLLISIYDNEGMLTGKRKKGGVVIKDTVYPPPNTYMDYIFTKQFIVKKLVITREDTSNNFKVELTCEHDKEEFEYILASSAFKADPFYPKNQVMIFDVDEKLPPVSGNSVLLSSGNDITFQSFPASLPFFIVENMSDWGIVDIKKGMIYLE